MNENNSPAPLFRVGKLYEIKQNYWMIYPSKEAVNDCASVVSFSKRERSARASVDSLKKAVVKAMEYDNVSFLPPGSTFVVLRISDGDDFVQIAGSSLGWIYLPHEWEMMQHFSEVTSSS